MADLLGKIQNIATNAVGSLTGNTSSTESATAADKNTATNPFEGKIQTEEVGDKLEIGKNNDTQNTEQEQKEQELKEAKSELQALLAQKAAAQQSSNAGSQGGNGGCGGCGGCGGSGGNAAQPILNNSEMDERIAELQEKIQNLENSLGLNNQADSSENDDVTKVDNSDATDKNDKAASNGVSNPISEATKPATETTANAGDVAKKLNPFG